MTILVASTVAAYKCRRGDELAWLSSAEDLKENTPDIEFFCAVQVGQGHNERFASLWKRLYGLGGRTWTYSVDTGVSEITSGSRLNDICMGRNLAIEYAQRQGSTHILFLDTDLYVEGDCLNRLLEVDVPLVGGNVPSYCLDGPVIRLPSLPNADIREHWNTAGFLLVKREAFRFLRWRYDVDAGMTDDPCFAADAERMGFGSTFVRHDVIGDHEPLVPMENRGYDRSIISQ